MALLLSVINKKLKLGNPVPFATVNVTVEPTVGMTIPPEGPVVYVFPPLIGTNDGFGTKKDKIVPVCGSSHVIGGLNDCVVLLVGN